MSLAGQAAVAIWNDVDPERRADFYAWHGREHMPERLGIPGFRRGRRYVAIDGHPEYFTLYEADDLQALTGQAYAARLDHPTPWTLATVSRFRNVSRAVCRVAASFGQGEGGLIGTFRYAVPDDRAEAHIRRLRQEALPKLADAPGIAAVHLLIADRAASAAETAERRSRDAATTAPGWILLVEGWDDVQPFAATCRRAQDEIVPAEAPAVYGLYRLQASRGLPS